MMFVLCTAMVVFLFLSTDLAAQCAMCRANVKTNMDSGLGGVGRQLNSAILYLMAIPYLLVSLVAYVFFREKINAWVIARFSAIKSIVAKKELSH